MLQRIQTIYLILSCISTALMYVFAFAKIDAVEPNIFYFDYHGIMVDGKNMIDIPYVFIFALLILFTFGSIFLYKKRKSQLRVGRLNYLLHLFVVVSMYFSLDAVLEKIPNGSAAIITYGIGFYIPFVSVAFLFLANRAIKKDDDLIRSVERLR